MALEPLLKYVDHGKVNVETCVDQTFKTLRQDFE